MHVFVLMAVKALGQPSVQDLLAKSAPDPPWGAVGHHRKRPLRSPRPANGYQRSRKEVPGVPFQSHNFNMVVWGYNLVSEAEGKDIYATYSICVYA